MATATIGADANFLPLLQSLVGSSQDTTKNSKTTEDTNLDSTVNGLNNQLVTGTTGQTTNQTVQGNADIAGLQQILARQQQGITPEMLKAIFQKGAAEVPGLVNTYGNAVGARAGGNDPLAQMTLALGDKLTNQAALMQQSLLADSSTTAGRIADATRSQTTAGTTTGTNAQNTAATSSQATDTKVAKTGTENTGIQANTTVNNDQIMKLLTLALGGSAVNSLLPAGINGLLSGTGGLLKGTGQDVFSNAPAWLKSLLGMPAGTIPGVDTATETALKGMNDGTNPYQTETDALTQQLLAELTGSQQTVVDPTAADFWDMGDVTQDWEWQP
jgi:hypothetical protein